MFTTAYLSQQYEPPLVSSGAVCHLNAGDILSYASLGQQLWKNLIASPADGAAQAAYDFVLGNTSSAEASDPAFNGVIGNESKNEYFSFDGGQYFTLNGAMTTFLESLHKNNAAYTLLAWYETPSVYDFYPTLFDNTTGGLSTKGLRWYGGSSGATELRIANGSAASLGKSAAVDSVTYPNVLMNAVALDEVVGANGLRFYSNDGTNERTSTEDSTYTAPSALAADYKFQIGANGIGGDRLANGHKMFEFMIYNRALTLSELQQNYDARKFRYL